MEQVCMVYDGMGSISYLLLAGLTMAEKKLDSEWSGNILRNVWYDEWKDTITFENKQWTDPILKLNKEVRKDWDSRKSGGHGEWHQIASIPLIVVEQLMKEGIWNNTERLHKWLNDRDNVMFRTSSTIL